MLFEEVGKKTSFPVAAFDLDMDVQRWEGKTGLTYKTKIKCPLWVLPDVNRDTVKRMSILKEVTLRVVESDIPALVVGKLELEKLHEKNAPMEGPGVEKGTWQDIEQRLDEVLAAAI